VRAALGAADAVLISTPENNASLLGALKNAFDLASRPFTDNCLRSPPTRPPVHHFDPELVLEPLMVPEQVDDDSVALAVSEVISGRHLLPHTNGGLDATVRPAA
jgi:hypothetical protein